MTPSRLAWIGASVRLPLRVVSVLVIAPGRLLWLAATSGRRRSLRGLERECESHVDRSSTLELRRESSQ